MPKYTTRLTRLDRLDMRYLPTIEQAYKRLAADLDCSLFDAALILRDFINKKGGSYYTFEHLRDHGVALLVDSETVNE